MVSSFEFRETTLNWSRSYIAAVLNVTPDSFSDGGAFAGLDAAVARGRSVIGAGADIIDVGGESTRPGAAPVSAGEELERVIPVIRHLARLPVVISVDTTKAVVAEEALNAGAEIVNDISGGLFDPRMVEVVTRRGAVFVCGHVRGESLSDVHAGERDPPDYEEVAFALVARVAQLPAALRRKTIVDPGLGFGKGTGENLELLRRLGELGAATGCPVMVGPSRKRFLGELTGKPLQDRDSATVGACLAAVSCGAQILRVHDVEQLRPALTVYEAIRGHRK